MILKSDKECAELITFIEENEKLAWDIETTGLNVRKDEIIGFGVSNGEKGYYVAHKAYAKGKLHKLVSANMCVKVLNLLKSKNLITWNGSFDSRFTLHYFGVDLTMSIWSDGMLAKHTVEEEQPFRLKDVAKKLYGEDATEEQTLMKQSIKDNGGSSKEFYKADLDIMGNYCVQDCLLTYRIDSHYQSLIAKEGLTRFYHIDEVMPLYREVTIPMELKGVPLDMGLLRKAYGDIQDDLEKIEASIQSELVPLLEEFKAWYLWKDYPPSRTGLFAQEIADYNNWDTPMTKTGKYSLTAKTLKDVEESEWKSYLTSKNFMLSKEQITLIQMRMFKKSGLKYMFNLSSKHHLKKVFFEKLGEEPLSKTPTGLPQVNDDFLDLMAQKYDWVKSLRSYNKLIKLKGTYIERFLDREENGVFYPSFFQHRTVSGRYGSDLQQLPKAKDVGEPIVLKYVNLIRKFFIAGEGFKFIDVDYESLEPHVFAHVSGDQKLKDIFIKGHDFYSTIVITTEQLMDYSPDKKADNYLGKLNKAARDGGKPYALGIPYGMEDFALGLTLGIDQKQAQKKINGYLEGFPVLAKWMQDTDEQIRTKGYIKSEAGRIRHHKEAPAIYAAHGRYILNSLEVWKRFNENPKKYSSMKYLRKKYKNALDNGKNFQIQSLGASIVNRACIAIAREFKRTGIDGYICAQVHDQVISRVPEKHVERCKKSIQYLMENTYKISIPLKAPADVGDNFYDAH